MGWYPVSRVEEFYNGSVPPEVALWRDKVGMASVHQLDRLAFQPLRYDVSDLSESLKSEGVQEPVHVLYNVTDHTAHLGEGNHRLAAAKKAGLTHLPTVVHRRVGTHGEYGNAPMMETEDFPREERGGYVPGEFNPRYIGLDQEDTSNQPRETTVEDIQMLLRPRW